MLTYPLKLSFKIATLAPQIKVTDPAGQTILYVHQKLLALRQDIKVYADDAETQQVYQINSDSVLGFTANYTIKTPDGQPVGIVRRLGGRSLWKATYPIFDANGVEVGLIHEQNPWVKVIDALLGEIPFVGWIVALFLNPAYVVELGGKMVLLVKKKPSIFARAFAIEKQQEALSDQDEGLLLPSIVTMVLHERARK